MYINGCIFGLSSPKIHPLMYVLTLPKETTPFATSRGWSSSHFFLLKKWTRTADFTKKSKKYSPKSQSVTWNASLLRGFVLIVILTVAFFDWVSRNSKFSWVVRTSFFVLKSMVDFLETKKDKLNTSLNFQGS